MKGQMKIFGLGLSKTGTTSLAHALSILGYRCSHYPRDPRTREQLLDGDFKLDLLERVDAVMDSPVVPFFRDFDRLYPGSKFILTVRDLEPWLASVERQWQAYPIKGPHDHRIPVRLALYGTVGFNPDRFADVWRQHHAAVREHFKGRESALLELDICSGEGWKRLCPFLGEPVPEEPFPHANAGVGKVDEPTPAVAVEDSDVDPVMSVTAAAEQGEGAFVHRPMPVRSSVSAFRPRLMFCSWHAYLDSSSGAALSTRDLFEDLTAQGWDCRVVCGPKNDFEDARSPAEILSEQGLGYHRERCAPVGGPGYELLHYQMNGVPISQYLPQGYHPRPQPEQAEVKEFLDVLGRAWAKYRPDVVLTYGGSPVGPVLLRGAKAAGVRVVFSLHNFAYKSATWLGEADVVRVPTPFAARRYRELMGLEAQAVPWPWGPARSVAPSVQGRYVTFVNPQPVKGSAVFARIVKEMSTRRPEIPFLVVEGRGGVSRLQGVQPDLSGLTNLHGMHATPRPSEFYAQSKVVLMPSVWEETFGRVAVEAIANGIPVLASRRGALPETLGGAGFLFDLPARCLEDHRQPPSAEEVRPWLETLERLFDDPDFHASASLNCFKRAGYWHPDRLRLDVEHFFCGVAAGQMSN